MNKLPVISEQQQETTRRELQGLAHQLSEREKVVTLREKNVSEREEAVTLREAEVEAREALLEPVKDVPLPAEDEIPAGTPIRVIHSDTAGKVERLQKRAAGNLYHCTLHGGTTRKGVFFRRQLKREGE